MDTVSKNKKQIDLGIFLPPLVFIVIFCACVVVNPDSTNSIMDSLFAFVTGDMGWAYHMMIFGFCILFLYFVFGKYATIKLGDSKPDFKTLSWLGMMFSSMTSAMVLWWASIEFYYYLESPPFGAEPFSLQAYEWASSYGLFHWGFTPWAMTSVLAVPYAYVLFIKKKDVVRPSVACSAVLGERLTEGWLGKLIDVFFIVGLVAGAGASMGLGTPLVAELVSKIFGVEHTLTVDGIIVFSWTILITLSVYFGLQKGIKVLSDIRVYLAFAVIIFLVIVGPTSFMFNNFCDGLGHLLQNLLKMSFYTDPHAESGFPQGWTIFWWAWYVVYAVQTAIYIARISKGRTVRELVLGTCSSATLGGWMCYLVFQNFSMDIVRKGILPVGELMNQYGGSRTIVEIWSQIPLSGLMLIVLLVLTFISTATLFNGAAFTLAMVTTKKLTGEEEPAGWNRVFWAVALGSVALSLMYLGGLQPLKTFNIICSFPMIFVIILIMVSFFKETSSIRESSSKENEVLLSASEDIQVGT